MNITTVCVQFEVIDRAAMALFYELTAIGAGTIAARRPNAHCVGRR